MREEDSIAAATAGTNSSLLVSDFFPFRHRELLNAPATGHPWDQKKLVNKLNYLNFIESFAFLIVCEKNSDKFYLLKVYPQPCVKNELTCRVNVQSFLSNIVDYSIEYLMIDDGLNAILAPVNCVSAQHNVIKLSLPENCQVKKLHKTRRYYCKDVFCELVQGSFKARGRLIDFTPTAFSILLDNLPDAESFLDNRRVELTLSSGNQKFFTGPCKIIRDSVNSDKLIVLTPEIAHLERFPKRKMRNPRHIIKPSFILRFNHPLFQKKIERDIQDISTAGFSIMDTPEEEVLIPGLHIPEATILYAGVLKIPCSIQVLYRREDKNNNCVYLGLTITDMDLKSYTTLNHILGTYVDSSARVSTEVDMDALWEFFFDTGFIYGEKYEHLYSYREDFKRTYEKLYQGDPEVARHFIYEKNGKIYGHIAMIHAYEPTWIIHHFSSLPFQSKVPALSILKELTFFTNGFYRLPSSPMKYAITYYQPDNKIVDKIFGGFTEYLKDKKGSSLDLFSYTLLQKNGSLFSLPAKWVLRNYVSSDLIFIKSFYNNISDGLLIETIGFDSNPKHLKNSFASHGLLRDYKIFCLEYCGRQIAFFIINKSNLGLNLSDLINCIKVIIIDENQLPLNIFISTVNNLINHNYNEENVPLLVFPSRYLSDNGYYVNKFYRMWALKTNDIYLDKFTEYMNLKFRMKYGN
ncbi:MAG TPA: hypothetical protein P5294_10170 [Smithellaceae bacterium]|nr:hypothetical protein [Smithellaceae bacterium]HRV26894.1 hypothetical protein [Smithellaceae bacterium]